MTAIDILSRAITATGMSARKFGVEVLGIDPRSIRKWLGDERAIPPNVRIVCQAIIDRPVLAEELIAAHARLVEAGEV